ncbi:MAG: hypothetical protein LLF94_02900, partial [Chlamydiales bacterium]|nr:hypothetical protein [Chlamydiales bacterium]
MPVAIEHVYVAPKPSCDQIVERLNALNTGMTLDELTHMVSFIESLRQAARHTPLYLRKEDTLLARTL